MKTTFSFKPMYALLAIAGSILITSCDKEEDDFLVAATFTSAVSEMQQAPRFANSAWKKGDDIGISGSSAGMVYANVKYVTIEGDGQFTAAEVGNRIYYQGDEQVSFDAYYPFTGTEGKSVGVITREITAGDQRADAQPFIDYLYGTGEGSAEEPEVKLQFKHCMSRVVLKFLAGNGFDALPEDMECTVGDLIMQGNFDTSRGIAYANENEKGKSIVLDVPAASAGERLLQLILFPQSTPRASVVVKVGKMTFYSTLNFEKTGGNPEVGLHPGRSYLFNVTVNQAGLFIREANVTEWFPGNGNGTDVDANM